MKYDKFIKLIKNELNYDCVINIIIYDRAEFAKIYINNEREWKIVLKEMHAKEFIRFLFIIQFAINNDYMFQISYNTRFK